MDDAGMCADIRPLLGVYLTGAIAPADRAVAVRHLAACADCRAELAGLAGLPGLLRRPPVHAAAEASAADDTAPDRTDPDCTDPDFTTPGYPTPDFTTPDSTVPDFTTSGSTVPDSTVPGGAGAGRPAGAMPGRLARRRLRRRRRRRWLLAGAAVVLAIAGGAGWALHLIGPPAPGPDTAATILHTRNIGDVTVLTDDEGYTLYWFGPDTATKSACEGSCAGNWPPVTGPAAWGPGVTGTIGAIVRPGGSLQATYNGHPLYTTTADTGPGQTKGNGVWSHGGEWHEVTVPGYGS
jgi:predicted lipoprotein with Yx(FWY)xxD motif